MSLFAPAPEPATKLGRYRALAPSAAIHVSPLALGGMSVGEKWADQGMGSMNKESSIKLLDAFFDAGGNYIDTANYYQDEDSEIIIGDWMAERGIRDQVVIATKYTTGYKKMDPSIQHKVNYFGNNLKSMNVSLDASLKKLRTSYIDVYYVHWWDYQTSIEEVMNGLHNLVTQGKVLYLGISDTPAWIVAKANQYARLTGKTPFCVYQGAWSILQRDFERDIIPMCRSEGMGLSPWNVIGGGRLRSDAEEKKREESGEGGRTFLSADWRRTEAEKKISNALEQVSNELGGGFSVSAVAIAYVMHKAPYVIPLVGGRKIEQLQDNIKALSISLSDKQIKFLESQAPFDPGFPHNMIGDGSSINAIIQSVAHIDAVPILKAFTPAAN